MSIGTARVFIRFQKDTATAEAQINQEREEVEEIKEDIDKNVGQQVQNLQRDTLNVLGDIERFKTLEGQLKLTVEQDIVIIERANRTSQLLINELGVQVANIQKDVDRGVRLQAVRRQRFEALQSEIEAQEILIDQRNQRLEQRIDKQKDDVTILEQKTTNIQQRLGQVAAGISAASGFLQLFQALTDETEQTIFNTAIVLAGNLMTTALAYGALGASTGAWQMILAAGTAASSAATIISSLKAAQRRQQYLYESQRRRTQNLKISY